MGEKSATSRTFTGKVKSFSKEKGFGFITCMEAHELFERDVFLHKAQLVAGCEVGHEVKFRIHVDEKGQPKAHSLQNLSAKNEEVPVKSALCDSVRSTDNLPEERVHAGYSLEDGRPIQGSDAASVSPELQQHLNRISALARKSGAPAATVSHTTRKVSFLMPSDSERSPATEAKPAKNGLADDDAPGVPSVPSRQAPSSAKMREEEVCPPPPAPTSVQLDMPPPPEIKEWQ